MNFKELIDPAKIPAHVAIIMDGNGRWAKERGKLRVFGHHQGVVALRDTIKGAVNIGIRYLTVYTFSADNWKRPKLEVTALMELMVATIKNETKTLMEHGVRLNAIGDLTQLPSRCKDTLLKAIEKTSNNTNCVLTLALSYSSRWEIARAARILAERVQKGEIRPEDINENLVESALATQGIPDPELLIRTSGEQRISDYLLWQIAYSELYFTDKLWPDFRKADLFEAILEFQKRERRFGLTGDQLT